MAPSLAHFPELCLEVIFKHVPLSDLLCSVGLVCKSWHKLRRTELKKRRHLLLVTDGKQETLYDYHTHLFSNGTDLIGRVRRDDGSPWHALESVEQIKFNTLTVPGGQWPTGRMQTFIASLKNLSITRLHLKFDCSHSDLTKVIRQLDHFSKNLVELKLFSFHPHRRQFENGTATQKLADRLFVCLNRMQSLKHLQLDLFLVNVRVRPEQLSWLSRLENFAIYTCNFVIEDWILAALDRYARNVTSIEVYNIVSLRGFINFVKPQIDCQLAAKFTTLSLIIEDRVVPFFKYEFMRRICTHFSSLTKLELHSYFFSMPMTKLARCLSLLTQLVHLALRYGPIPPIEEEDEGDEGDKEDKEDEEDEEEEDPVEEEQDGGEHAEQVRQEITQLPSVRLLNLSFSANSHRDTERLFISDIFPNLQVLALKNIYFQCQDCEIGPREDGGYHRTEGTDCELARRIAQCSRLARRPFRGCASLHTVALIDLDNNQTLITLDDL